MEKRCSDQVSLSGDISIEHGSGRWSNSKAAVLPVPSIIETYTAASGGKTSYKSELVGKECESCDDA